MLNDKVIRGHLFVIANYAINILIAFIDIYKKINIIYTIISMINNTKFESPYHFCESIFQSRVQVQQYVCNFPTLFQQWAGSKDCSVYIIARGTFQ